MLDFLRKRPMLLSAVISSAVSVVGLYTEKALFLICGIILSFFFIAIYKNRKFEIIFASFMVFAVAMSVFFTVQNKTTISSLSKDECIGEFVVIEEPKNLGEFYSATVETVNSNLLKKGDKIAVTYDCGYLEYSQKINATILLSTLEDKSVKTYYYSKGIYTKGFIKDLTSTNSNDFVLQKISLLRNFIKTQIFEHYSPSSASTMLALLTGDDSYFTNEFYTNVKRSGVAHIMVVSGMHLSIIVSLFLYLSNKFLYNRFLKAVIIFGTVLLVSAVCGFTMSILRAGITYILICISLLINRRHTAENTLGSAVTFILVINPFAIFNIGFLLSVLSTFSILAVALPVTEFVNQKRIIKSKLLLALFSSVLISLCALIFTSPITIYVFGYISNVSVITNLLVSYAVNVAFVLCILGLLIPFTRKFVFWTSEIMILYINAVINYFGELKLATTNLPKIIAIFSVIIIIAIFNALLACKKRNDMLKLEKIITKKNNERGGKLLWQ